MTAPLQPERLGLPPMSGGALPIGRWTCTLEDLAPFHALPDASHRAAIWGEWMELTSAVRSASGAIAACWLAGSYFTDKSIPSDLDCVYVIDRERLLAAEADVEAAQLLGVVGASQAKDYFNVRVDSFILSWWPRGGTLHGSDVRRASYLEARGYWDDLWLRRRSSDAREAKVPTRGYVEVIMDGYV